LSPSLPNWLPQSRYKARGQTKQCQAIILQNKNKLTGRTDVPFGVPTSVHLTFPSVYLPLGCSSLKPYQGACLSCLSASHFIHTIYSSNSDKCMPACLSHFAFHFIFFNHSEYYFFLICLEEYRRGRTIWITILLWEARYPQLLL